MRKLILISAFVLASASAQACDIGSLIPANDTPAAASTAAPAEATPTQRQGSRRRPGRGRAQAQPARDTRAKGAPDRRAVRHLLVMRGFIIVAVMFWLALSYQNNHRDFGPAKVETVR